MAALLRRPKLPLDVVEPLALELEEPVTQLLDEEQVARPVR